MAARYSPLFVCEGSTANKLNSIKNSVYLNTIYEDVFDELGKNIVFYGWNMNEEDDHIFQRLLRHRSEYIERVAFSVYKDGNEKEFMTRVTAKFNSLKPEVKIDFYSSDSPGCWNN